MNRLESYSLKARYLLPMDREPLRDAWISVVNGCIVAVGGPPQGVAEDLGSVAILPGLINAHTHLEFSELPQPLGQPECGFTDWIREVIRWRNEMRERSAGVDWRNQAVSVGLAESLRGGATTVAEIATLPWQSDATSYRALHGIVFLELLGLSPERQPELLVAAQSFLDGTRHATYRVGLSPHAPYTVSPVLVARLAELSAQESVPLAMHLAETREELELLHSARGPFRELLDGLGAWHENAIRRDTTPLDYLQLLSLAHRSLIIHGNYLTDVELEFLGRHRDRMSVIYCPRTHAYFGHEPYPLQRMIEFGVNVALGTDSRASNPDLNMLEELRFAARAHSDIPPATMLQLATANAARALGLEHEIGTLAVGKRADLIVVPLPDEDGDPSELVLHSRTPATRVDRVIA